MTVFIWSAAMEGTLAMKKIRVNSDLLLTNTVNEYC